ncbi:hypothetical protein HDZ31DRAFT_74770 [Schizophyllum fasciatum]
MVGGGGGWAGGRVWLTVGASGGRSDCVTTRCSSVPRAMESRKQNTACDACRARKVKCNRTPGSDRCVHCAQKNLDCTHFQQQATQHKKRQIAKPDPAAPPHPLPPPSAAPPPPAARPPGRPSAPPTLSAASPVPDVLAHLLAPPDTGFAAWGPAAASLASPAPRAELAADLAEVYLQIVHPRLPLLNPARLRAQLRAPPAAPAPIHPALLATVLAWGAKFAEHPLLLADRSRNHGHSALAAALIHRTRALAEALAVHRVPAPDHILCALLIEPLQSQDPRDSTAFHGFWLRAAVQHLLHLRINHKATLAAIRDPDARGTMVFAWWMACLSDAYGSAYYRRKPMLDDDDYDIDFYTAQTATVGSSPPNAPTATSPDAAASPRDQLEVLGYYRAAHALARIARTMSRRLWTPAAESGGIPHATLRLLTQALDGWRTAHLAAVGVPRDFGRGWGFVEAVSTCASDATFHVMWVILFGALDEFGVKEFAGSPDPAAAAEKDEVCDRIADEALHGALRIAGLAAVLTQNGYLRLDPAVMHVSCIHAGGLLARLGRPEVQACIQGLEQYAHAYKEADAQASALKTVYEGVLRAEAQGGNGEEMQMDPANNGANQEYGYEVYRQGYSGQQDFAYSQGNESGTYAQNYSDARSEQYGAPQQYENGNGRRYGNGQGYATDAYGHARSMSPNGGADAGPSGYGQPEASSTVPSSAAAAYQQTSYARSSSAPTEYPQHTTPGIDTAYPSISSSRGVPSSTNPLAGSAVSPSSAAFPSKPGNSLESSLAAQGFPLHPHARGFPTGARGLRWMKGVAREINRRFSAAPGSPSGHDGMDVAESG